MTTTGKTNKPPVTSKSGASEQERTSVKGYVTILAIGDALAFLAFAAIGTGSHGKLTGFAAIPGVVLTALPFLAAWFAVAPFVGAYRRELAASPRKMAARTLLSWVGAWLVAMALWGIFVDHGIPPLSFAVVALLFNAALLLIWRWPYALNNQNKHRA